MNIKNLNENEFNLLIQVIESHFKKRVTHDVESALYVVVEKDVDNRFHHLERAIARGKRRIESILLRKNAALLRKLLNRQ